MTTQIIHLDVWESESGWVESETLPTTCRKYTDDIGIVRCYASDFATGEVRSSESSRDVGAMMP